MDQFVAISEETRKPRTAVLSDQVLAELDRISRAWGTSVNGWGCQFTSPAGCVLSAYVGKPTCVVAIVTHIDLREGLKQLLSALETCDAT